MFELEPKLQRTGVIFVGVLVGVIGILFYAVKHWETPVQSSQTQSVSQPFQPAASVSHSQPEVQSAPASDNQDESNNPRVRSCTVMVGLPGDSNYQAMLLTDGSTLNVQVVPVKSSKDHVLVNVRELSLSTEDYQPVLHKNLVWYAHFDRKEPDSDGWYAYRDHPNDTVELGRLGFEFNRKSFSLSMNMPDSPPKFVHGDCSDDDEK